MPPRTSQSRTQSGTRGRAGGRTKTDKTVLMKPRFIRKKVCRLCGEKVSLLDYKDLERLAKFLTERGKILPRRISGNCAKHQRQAARAIKRARMIALIPFQIA